MNGTDEITSDPDPLAFLMGGGEMGGLIRSMDWAKTSLGAVAGWPQSLRTTVSICLASDLPICVIWGPGLVQMYNDAYRVICGDKHPRSMGQNFSECFREAWPVIGDAHDSALAGDTAFLEAQQIFLERHGYVEECFFTFSFSPIRDEAGRVGGLFHPVIEMTTQMLSERRTRTLRDLAAQTSKAKSADEALFITAQVLAEHSLDLPFVLLYALDTDGDQARLVGATGLNAETAASLGSMPLGGAQTVWPLAEVVRSGSAVHVDDVRQRVARACVDPDPDLPDAALAVPIILPGADRPTAIFIAGISSRLPMNEAYRSFYDLLATSVISAVANAGAYEDERRRAKALAELDRAKTTFFSNISHEFRTPLTLMLGPIDDALVGPEELPPMHRAQLEIVYRNGLRLQRLVNGLLDFSRIEAGRVRAAYEPTELAGFTADLASNFRSACEKAGLELRVDCPPLGEPVFVDRPMWEMIVLNLLSNAFKFTFDGTIAVTLQQAGRAAELVVRDSGTGVPADEIPRLFERFHRVENARGRTHEGSGIGLAMVHEMVKLHGGTITAESQVDRGTTFRISIPFGDGHLPAEQVGGGRIAAPTAGASPFVQEAMGWLPEAGQRYESGAESAPLRDDSLASAFSTPRIGADRPCVLVADDNVDMRRYLERLLNGHYKVEAVPDGEAALAAVRQRIPDLILTDVMMPRLDGFGLLRALRTDPRTAGVPVILLSARAGEESQVEGMEAGADAYLVKPFSARELLARVGALIQVTRLRQDAAESIRVSEGRFRALVSASSDVIYRMSADWTEMRHLQGREFVPDTHEPSRSWLHKYIAPDDQPGVMEAIQAAIRCKGVFALEHRVVRVDGTLGWTFSRAVPLLDGNGEILEWFGAASDVTSRKRAEEELRRSEERQRYLVRLGDALRPLADPATIQGEAVRMLGEHLGPDRAYYVEVDALRAEYVVEREWRRGGVASHARRYPVAAWPMPWLANGRPWVVCDVNADSAMPDDQRASYRANDVRACVVVPLFKDGRMAAALVVNAVEPRDWTAAEIGLLEETAERTWAAVERARAEEALKETDRRKDEFLAMLGHELRNPLAPIRAVSELLEMQLGMRPEYQPILGVLDRQSMQLTRLVDDLLDVARVTQGRVALKLEPVECGSVIEQAIETVQTLAAEKSHQLRTHRPGEKLYVSGDRARLVQTVTNLLHNAIKYTDPQGTITLAVSATGQELVLSVHDTGIGISAELLPHVFDLFVQSERSLDRAQGGLGIGLSVARHLVGMHHGTLQAHSAGFGHGSTFEIRLPRISAPDRVEKADVVKLGAARRILIIDDNRDAANSLALILKIQGHSVDVVYRSTDALERVAQQHPEVVLLDIGMPEMDGYAVARALRAHHGDSLRLIALTGYGRPEDRERSGAAGFDAHLVKPIDVQMLRSHLAQ